MKRTAFGLLAAAGVFCAFGLEAQATTIDFGDTTAAGGSCIENSTHPCYGDNVSSTSDTFGTYGEGNGFTPNVTTEYAGANHRLTAVHASHGGGYVLSTSINGAYSFTLNAETGYEVQLNEVTIKNAWLPGSPESDTFEVWADGNHLNALDFTYSGEAPMVFSFANLVAQSISIVGFSSVVGIAAANFDQLAVGTVPVPAALPLFASALAGLGFARWRKGKQAAKAA